MAKSHLVVMLSSLAMKAPVEGSEHVGRQPLGEDANGEVVRLQASYTIGFSTSTVTSLSASSQIWCGQNDLHPCWI
ncbi:hypothetical protein E2562_030239 [Oryza meyeriana var. granulata]|uniref:Uncharacterized protein n=1 Tax=Oryza meyeriana var. granulata TaxID=110450 RepID=A0A6G1DB21_9ORYZ|nr:hypothetical protein E2562_030239 [Oryza meyeriana var. granulata]